MMYEDEDFEKMDRGELVDVVKLLRNKLLMCHTFFVLKAKPDNVRFPDFIEKGLLEEYFLARQNLQ